MVSDCTWEMSERKSRQVSVLCLNGGGITGTGSERRAVLRHKKMSSVLDVVLELPERHLVTMCPAGAWE